MAQPPDPSLELIADLEAQGYGHDEATRAADSFAVDMPGVSLRQVAASLCLVSSAGLSPDEGLAAIRGALARLTEERP